MTPITLDELCELAFSVDEGDPIDWGVFQGGKEQTMRMMAASVLEQFNKDPMTRDDILVMMAIITKLLTENMILHTRDLTKR